MNKKALLLIAVALLAALAGCSADGGESEVENSDEDVEYESVEVHTDTNRFVDEEAGVVCYKYGEPRWDEAGISCIPINQTDLNRNGY